MNDFLNKLAVMIMGVEVTVIFMIVMEIRNIGQEFYPYHILVLALSMFPVISYYILKD